VKQVVDIAIVFLIMGLLYSLVSDFLFFLVKDLNNLCNFSF
jgi:hypothetical protein